MPEQLLRLPSVKAATGRSRASIYADMADGTFPKPVRIGTRSVAWRQSDIDKWIESRPSVDIGGQAA